MQNKRGCGILMHPTSLPGPGGIGSLGDDARRFVDLLQAVGMSYWQVLPLSPAGYGNSPYSALSAFACNPLLIDLEQLVAEGDLSSSTTDGYPSQRVDFGQVIPDKLQLLQQAATRFLSQPASQRRDEFEQFCHTHDWLDDYALFMAIKQRQQGAPWNRWPAELAHPTAATRERCTCELAAEIDLQRYLQWQAFRQWHALRQYANLRGIALIGDIPIFVAYDSADVWSRRELFLLDSDGNPSVVAGVPPDYFSATGQLWGNPLYDWDLLEQQGYQWWIERCRLLLELFDLVRVDHFRGFEAAWQIPAKATTAVDGAWVPGPGERLFDALQAALGELPIIAEDLGVITPAVLALRDRYRFPGMKILQFAFDADIDDRDLPHNHEKHGVVYTGTHDNDTTKGWYTARTAHEREEMHRYLGTSGEDGVGDLLRAALMSVADMAIIPLQDLLRLDSAARMNIPGTPSGNWEWRFTWEMIPPDLIETLRHQLVRYGRIQRGAP
jgi:4-alpha-glucanotransferase